MPVAEGFRVMTYGFWRKSIAVEEVHCPEVTADNAVRLPRWFGRWLGTEFVAAASIERWHHSVHREFADSSKIACRTACQGSTICSWRPGNRRPQRPRLEVCLGTSPRRVEKDPTAVLVPANVILFRMSLSCLLSKASDTESGVPQCHCRPWLGEYHFVVVRVGELDPFVREDGKPHWSGLSYETRFNILLGMW